MNSRPRIGLKIELKKTNLLRLVINKEEEVEQDNEKFDQVDSFTYLRGIINTPKMIKV